MKTKLETLIPGDYANYRAAGALDGHAADVYASKTGNDQISIAFGPATLVVSVAACRELVAHLNAAIEAQQTAGGAGHE